mmetsp:Transcript_17050/g.34529  ORF Transcript_17050/g.34529 Transcript_17050/m.34529 type:complete len:254 (+) Transcript_17050:1382-2143(+)
MRIDGLEQERPLTHAAHHPREALCHHFVLAREVVSAFASRPLHPVNNLKDVHDTSRGGGHVGHAEARADRDAHERAVLRKSFVPTDVIDVEDLLRVRTKAHRALSLFEGYLGLERHVSGHSVEPFCVLIEFVQHGEPSVEELTHPDQGLVPVARTLALAPLQPLEPRVKPPGEPPPPPMLSMRMMMRMVGRVVGLVVVVVQGPMGGILRRLRADGRRGRPADGVRGRLARAATDDARARPALDRRLRVVAQRP